MTHQILAGSALRRSAPVARRPAGAQKLEHTDPRNQARIIIAWTPFNVMLNGLTREMVIQATQLLCAGGYGRT